MILENLDWNDLQSRYEKVREDVLEFHTGPFFNELEQEDFRYSINLLELDERYINSLDSVRDVLLNTILYVARDDDGENIVQMYNRVYAEEYGPHQQRILASMANAKFGLLRIKSVLSHIGLHVHDLLHDEEHLLLDFGLAASGSAGAYILTHYFQSDNFILTTGAALPLSVNEAEAVSESIVHVLKMQSMSYNNATPVMREILEGTILAMAIKSGAASRVRYDHPNQVQLRKQTKSARKSKKKKRR